MNKILQVSSLLLLFASCADLNEVTKDPSGQSSQIVASSEQITAEGQLTRVVPMPKNGETGTGYTFPWQANDKIAIYGSTTDASGWGFFTISEGVNASVGSSLAFSK